MIDHIIKKYPAPSPLNDLMYRKTCKDPLIN